MRKIKYIDIGVEKIGKIYHIADVHIRNLKDTKSIVKYFPNFTDIFLLQ